MPYVDKVQVGGTDYDIQDTKAQAKVDELKKHILFPPAYPVKGAGYNCPQSLTVPQGGCFANGHFLLYFTNSNDSAGQVKFLDATGVEVGNQAINLSHGNDLTYDYDNNLVYAVVGSTIKAYTFDTSNCTLTLSDTITPAIAVHGLAYIGNGEFAAYSIADNALYLLDNAMQSATLVINDVYPGADHRNAWYHHGIAYDGDGYIYVVARDKVNDMTNVIFVYDIKDPNTGAYVGTICYPRGLIELEWVDFYDDLMYAGFLTDNSTEIVRADYYRNEHGALQRSYSLYGKTSPNYIYFDNTATNKFSGGLYSSEPIANNQYLVTILNSISNVCLRYLSTCTELQLNSFDGMLQAYGNGTLATLTIINCKINCLNIINVNTLTLTTSEISGIITAIEGTIANSNAPMCRIRTGVVNGSFISIWPRQNAQQSLTFQNDSVALINGLQYDARFGEMPNQSVRPLLTGMIRVLSGVSIGTSYSALSLGTYARTNAVMAIPIPMNDIKNFQYYYALESGVPTLYLKADEANNNVTLRIVFLF